MRKLPDRGETALKRIVASVQDVDVQVLAAAALLTLDETFATTLLGQICRGQFGFPSLDAVESGERGLG